MDIFHDTKRTSQFEYSGALDMYLGPITTRPGPLEKQSRPPPFRLGSPLMSSAPPTICLGLFEMRLRLFEMRFGSGPKNSRLRPKRLGSGPKIIGRQRIRLGHPT